MAERDTLRRPNRRVILFFGRPAECAKGSEARSALEVRMEGSSWNQISIGLPRACCAAVSSTSAKKFYGMARPSFLRRRSRRDTLIDCVGKLPPCIVAMEACCGADHLGRLFAAQGHDVRLMSPEYVRPYVKAQKNDDRDAAGIAEAATRPTMRFVETKTEARLDMQTRHRSRDRLGGERTALINQLRAILLERGLLYPRASANSNNISSC